jgi:integrase
LFHTGRWNSFQASADDLSDLWRIQIIFTARKYKYAFSRWIKWCSSQHPPIQQFPTSDFHVSLYIIHLSKKCNSMAQVNEAYYAIWAHDLTGVKNPCHSSLVNSVKEGARRITAHPVWKKDPISPEMLKKIVKRFGTLNNNLLDVWIACVCLISFAGFLRFSELVNLRRSDIQFYYDYVALFIAKSKTDKYKQGNCVNISKSGKFTCPYEMLKLYLQKANIPADSDCYIFRAIKFCKKSKKLGSFVVH